MKTHELKDGNIIKAITVLDHICPPDYSTTIEDERIRTIIITDGDAESSGIEEITAIDSFRIGKKEYKYGVDTLKTNYIVLNNHSYVISFLLVQKWGSTKKGNGMYHQVEDLKLYVRDKKDRVARKNLRCALYGLSKTLDECRDRSFLESIVGPLPKTAPKVKQIGQYVYTIYS